MGPSQPEPHVQITSTSSVAAFEQIPEAQTGSFGVRAGARVIGDQWAGTIVAKASAIPEQARRPQQMAIIGVIAGFVTHGLVITAFTLLGRF